MIWNIVRVNDKKSCITKWRSPFEKILSTVSNLQSDTKTMEESTEYVLQGIIYLSDDNLKDTFFYLESDLVFLTTSRSAQLWGIFHKGRVSWSQNMEQDRKWSPNRGLGIGQSEGGGILYYSVYYSYPRDMCTWKYSSRTIYFFIWRQSW